MESATRRASFEINISPYITLGTSRQLRPRMKKSYTGDITVKGKGDNTKSKIGKNGDIKSKFGKKGDNAKSKIVKNGDNTKSKAGGPAAGSRKKSSKKILRESNPKEIKIVAVVYPISQGKDKCHTSELSRDGKKGVEVDMDMKAMKKGQENNSDMI